MVRFFGLLCCLFLAAGAAVAAPTWGYGYDSLLTELALWRSQPDARVDSFGASVQGRGLWMVTITDSSDSLADVPGRTGPKRRVMVHARTHPWEVQAFYVAREMIRCLLDTTAVARSLRRDFIFHVVPQYNPDGVELGTERTNANGVDLESNWSAVAPQAEVIALKGLFQSLMAGSNPVAVALNLHSDQYNGKRFFVFHVEAGTSWIYTEEEKRFIAAVRSHFASGIEDWDFLTSWASGPATRYPEGFWWTNHREKVMALTYEDDNSPTAGMYDSSGRALVYGVARFLRDEPIRVQERSPRPERLTLVRGGVKVSFDGQSRWTVIDLAGRRISSGTTSAGETLLSWNELRGGGMRILVVHFPDRTMQLRLPGL